jgi:hypothetical protein
MISRNTAKALALGFLIFQGLVFVGTAKDQEERAWTVMVYLDVDNDIAEAPFPWVNWYDPVIYGIGAVGSSEDLVILILMDLNSYGDSRIYSVDPNGNFIAIDDIGRVIPTSGEVNMGSPQTLIDFGLWSMENYPSQHTALVMMDHGGSWRKSMVDDTNGEDALTTPELGEAMSVLQPDVLAFDACVMASAEVVYEVKDYVDYYCGAEEVEIMTATFFRATSPFDYRAPLTALKNDPTTTPEELSILFVESFDPYSAWGSADQTFSAVDTDKMVDLGEAIDHLADLLLEDMGSYRDQILKARGDAREYYPAPERGQVYIYVDLYDLADKISYYVDDEAIDEACQVVIGAVNDAVIANNCIMGDDSYGLTIFMPDIDYGWIFDDLIQRYRQTQFGIDFSWDEMLEELFY